MKITRTARIIAIPLLSMALAMPVFASTSMSDAKKEKKDLQSQLKDVKEELNDLKTKAENTNDYLKQLDSKATELTEQLVNLDNQITAKRAELESNEKALAEAEATSQRQYEDMKKRIKFLYESGNNAYIEMLLNSKSFADLLNKADFVQEMSEYDRNMLTEYQNTQQTIADKQKQIELEYQQIEQLQADTEQQKQSIEALAEEKEKEYSAYKSQISDSEALEKEVEAEIEEQNAIIAQIEAEEARKRKAAEEAAKKAAISSQNVNQSGSSNGANTPSVSANGFTWPCPGSRRITSDFGYRNHPISGGYKMHNGIDISAPTGTVIVAAATGTVTAASYNASMGNYVMINHGGSLFTIYMHCSALNVSAGQTVNAGQTIAYVGSTGNSTGPHLHFSVRLNGSYVNPWNYVN